MFLNKKYLILLLIIILIELNISNCETLSYEQKVDIFNFLIKNNVKGFYVYLVERAPEICQCLFVLDSYEEIKFYVELLESDFYKN